MTNISCRTKTVHEKTTVTQASCPRKGRHHRAVDGDGDMPVQPREADSAALPADLRKYGVNKVKEACECFSGRHQKTVTKHVRAPTTVVCCPRSWAMSVYLFFSDLRQVVAVTKTKTECVVATCIANGVRCDVNNPGACCSRTCSVARGCI